MRKILMIYAMINLIFYVACSVGFGSFKPFSWQPRETILTIMGFYIFICIMLLLVNLINESISDQNKTT